MKLFKPSFIFLSAFALLIGMGCKNKKRNYNSELASINLLRGDLLLCGSGQFGEVSFSLSCKDETRTDFNLAISLLHSFEYGEAEKVFVKVIDADPDCAMAYWGVAMCNFHALWRPPTVEDLKKGSWAIEAARSIPGKLPRETEYIDAIATFYTNWDSVEHQTRVARFEAAMEKIYYTYPNDKEAAIFYALALNSGADLSDKTYKNRRKAGKILEQLFKEQPNHPGIAHYIIHSYDYPELAHKALETARRYAKIAPASSHAQHMPSHIFTRLGLWEESIASNLDATASAKCYGEALGMEGSWDEEIHGTDYLVYAYLQKGNTDDAKALLDYLKSVPKIYPIGVKAAYPSASIPSRYYVETRQWLKAANLEMSSLDFPVSEFPWSNSIVYFARVLGAVHTNNLPSAKSDLDQLQICHNILLKAEKDYMANQVMIMFKASEAWIHFLEGNREQALISIRTAAELELKTEKHSITPAEVVSAQELLGDLLFQMGDFSNALEAYELNLKIRPNRFNGIYGAAIAAKAAGDTNKATQYFEDLIKLTEGSNSDRPEVTEAKAFVQQKTI